MSTGILIMNTGTPDAPTQEAIKPYLAEFLSDRNIISMPRVLWQPILHLFILPNRPKKTVERYRSIWTDAGSPFTVVSQSQRVKLDAKLKSRGHDCQVYLGMRYGNPSVSKALEAMRADGCTRIVVLPLFPQHAKVTTLTCLQKVRGQLAQMGWQPEVIEIDHYCDNEAYLDALARSIESTWTWKEGSKLLFSYHSTLLADIEAGDPYRDQALATSAGAAKRLGIPDDGWAISWQCRFDSRKWLMPAPETVLRQWAKEGIRDVGVVCPVFSTDCIETLIDCGQEQKQLFEQECARISSEAGGASLPEPTYTYIPALNDSGAYISVLADVVEDNLR